MSVWGYSLSHNGTKEWGSKVLFPFLPVIGLPNKSSSPRIYAYKSQGKKLCKFMDLYYTRGKEETRTRTVFVDKDWNLRHTPQLFVDHPFLLFPTEKASLAFYNPCPLPSSQFNPSPLCKCRNLRTPASSASCAQ